MKSVSRYEKASDGGDSFAQQGCLIAQQNLPVCVNRTTCSAIITNLPSGWFYQYHTWSLINKSVVLIKRICGLNLTTGQTVYIIFIDLLCPRLEGLD